VLSPDRSRSSVSGGAGICEKFKDGDPFEGTDSRYPYHQPLKNSKGLPHGRKIVLYSLLKNPLLFYGMIM